MTTIKADEILNTSQESELTQTSEQITILRNFLEKKTPFANRHSFGRAPRRLRNIELARISQKLIETNEHGSSIWMPTLNDLSQDELDITSNKQFISTEESSILPQILRLLQDINSEEEQEFSGPVITDFDQQKARFTCCLTEDSLSIGEENMQTDLNQFPSLPQGSTTNFEAFDERYIGPLPLEESYSEERIRKLLESAMLANQSKQRNQKLPRSRSCSLSPLRRISGQLSGPKYKPNFKTPKLIKAPKNSYCISNSFESGRPARGSSHCRLFTTQDLSLLYKQAIENIAVELKARIRELNCNVERLSISLNERSVHSSQRNVIPCDARIQLPRGSKINTASSVNLFLSSARTTKDSTNNKQIQNVNMEGTSTGGDVQDL